ncbi:MAG: histidine phosphatase family protein [Arachnia sp.]
MAAPLYLVRHGESQWNVLRLTQGQTPHPKLTSRGRRQAEQAAELIANDLSGRRVAHVVTSDLVRAVETARIVQQRLGGQLSHDPRLREQSVGELEGQPYEAAWAATTAIDWSDPTVRIGGGESLHDVRQRMSEAMAEARGGEVRVLVSHGDSIRAGLAWLSGRSASYDDEWVAVPNGAVARVDDAVTWLS